MINDLCQGVLLEPPELRVLCSDSPLSGHPIRTKAPVVWKGGGYWAFNGFSSLFACLCASLIVSHNRCQPKGR